MLVLVSVQVQKELKDAHLLLAAEDLPAASLKSFFTDATGGYPRWRLVTAPSST